MKILYVRRRLRALALLLLLGVSIARAQILDENRAKLLVVMISAEMDDGPQNGAGEIVGSGNNRLYIVTANHVVRSGPHKAKSVKVKLSWLPGESANADLTDNFDQTMDIAVLVIKDASKFSIPALPFDAVGDARALRRGDKVFSMGFPQGKPWFSRPSPDTVASSSFATVQFDSSWIAPGYSGGGLFNDKSQLVGMIQKDDPPLGEAIPIQTVLDTVERWGFPVQLGRSGVGKPAAGTTAPDHPGTAPPAGGETGMLEAGNAATPRVQPSEVGANTPTGIQYVDPATAPEMYKRMPLHSFAALPTNASNGNLGLKETAPQLRSHRLTWSFVNVSLGQYRVLIRYAAKVPRPLHLVVMDHSGTILEETVASEATGGWEVPFRQTRMVGVIRTTSDKLGIRLESGASSADWPAVEGLFLIYLGP